MIGLDKDVQTFSRGSDRWAWRLGRRRFIICQGDIVSACVHLLGLFSIFTVAIAFDPELRRRPGRGDYASAFTWSLLVYHFTP